MTYQDLDTSKPLTAKLPQIGSASNHTINIGAIATALIAHFSGVIPPRWAPLVTGAGMAVPYVISVLAQYSRSPSQVTVTQAWQIYRMCKERGLDPDDLICRKFGEEMDADELTKKQGGKIIEYLKTIPVLKLHPEVRDGA